ncbi:jg16936 [Pararge aegeria aegeria]|uniref:Jg16936 protein n=1 Tax=Pararge aegeria aegeria TaxID=348720 RepID=A0A8S4QPN2_9NEOP|nr:jg16936 [Pararge aegeria aegeria]
MINHVKGKERKRFVPIQPMYTICAIIIDRLKPICHHKLNYLFARQRVLHIEIGSEIKTENLTSIMLEASEKWESIKKYMEEIIKVKKRDEREGRECIKQEDGIKGVRPYVPLYMYPSDIVLLLATTMLLSGNVLA